MKLSSMQFTTRYRAWLCMREYQAQGIKVLSEPYEKKKFWVFDFEQERDPSTESIQRRKTGRTRKDFIFSFTRIKRAPGPVEHGRWATYSNKRCRCALCVEAARQYSRIRNERKKGGEGV